jgi:transcriptional regulator with XRE-family HTH domain
VARARRPIDLRIASRLGARRAALGLSRERLARRVGLTAAQIHGFECGADRISASKVWALARALSIPVGYFFDEAPLELAELASADLAEILAAMPVACRGRLLEIAASLTA